MNKTSALILCLLISTNLSAQTTNEKGWYNSKDLENTDIGWISIIKFKDPPGVFSKNGRTYPASQMGFSQSIISWWQQAYVPRGLLGEMKQSVLAPDPPQPMSSSSYTYNEAEKDNRKALPNTYGGYARLHKCLVATKTHKFWPMPGNQCYSTWDVMANNVELISRQMVTLSSPDEYYGIQPRYTIGMKGEFDKEWMPKYAGYRNFTDSPNLKKYDHYLMPGTGDKEDAYVVVMTKDGKPLPFEPVTVGELIVRLEKQLPMMYKIAINNGSKDVNLMERARQGMANFKS